MGYGLKGPTTRYKHYWAAPWKGTGSAVVEHTAQRWKRGFHSSIAGVTASSKAVATQVALSMLSLICAATAADVLLAVMAWSQGLLPWPWLCSVAVGSWE